MYSYKNKVQDILRNTKTSNYCFKKTGAKYLKEHSNIKITVTKKPVPDILRNILILNYWYNNK